MKALRTNQTASSLRMPPALKYSGGKVVSKKLRSSKIAMAAKTLRMREWLERLMDKEECKGLMWVDKEEKKFKISWCHASRSDFDTKEHADLFIKYAEFTGRKDIADESKGYNSKLKSNFRSALHSLVDCIPIKVEGDKKAKGETTVKVYQFIDPSHPEYIRKKLQKTKNQRNGVKRNKPRTKASKEEPQATFEDDLDLPEDSSVTSPIILPDECEAFLANNTNGQSQLNAQFPSTISMIPQTTTTISDRVPAPPTLSFQPFVGDNPQQQQQISSVADSAATATPGDNNNFDMIPNPINVVIDVPALKVIVDNATPSLPKFRELGVNDTFDLPISHASQMLNSGGSMRVRKVKQKVEEQSLPYLTDFKLPPGCIQRQSVQPEQTRYNIFKVIEDATIFPDNATEDVQEEKNHFQNEMSFRGHGCFTGPGGVGQIISHNEAVTVVRQDPETISQGENYNLLDVGSMTYTS